MLGEALDFVNRWSGVLATLGALGTGLGTLLERRYHVTHRLGKLWAWFVNAGVEGKLKLECAAHADFEDIKRAFIEDLRSRGPIRIVHNGPVRLDLSAGGVLYSVLDTGPGAVYFGVARLQSTMRGLVPSLEMLFRTLRRLTVAEPNGKALVGALNYAEVALVLPYGWEPFRPRDTKRFAVSSYHVRLHPKGGSSEVEVTLENLTVRSTSLDDLIAIIRRFV